MLKEGPGVRRAVEWSESSLDDLADIYDYIEQVNPQAAEDLRESITTGVMSLLPTMSNLFRRGRLPGTREFVVHPNYLVVYRVTETTVTVLRVLHTKRQFPSDTWDGFPPRR